MCNVSIPTQYPEAVLAILEAYLGGSSSELKLKEAVRKLELPAKCEDDAALAAAGLITNHIDEQLPKWGAEGEHGRALALEWNIRIPANRLIDPTLVCTVRWTTEGKGFYWPIEFWLTYIDGFHVEILTARSPDVWGTRELVINVAPAGENRKAIALELMEGLWHNMMEATGAMWATWLEDGLVDAVAGNDLAVQMTNGAIARIPSVLVGDAPLEVFTREEINQLDRPAMLSLARLLRVRLAKAGPPPTHDELEGIRELLTEHLFAIDFKYAAKNGGGK
jgi:hypothetical protein